MVQCELRSHIYKIFLSHTQSCVLEKIIKSKSNKILSPVCNRPRKTTCYILTMMSQSRINWSVDDYREVQRLNVELNTFLRQIFLLCTKRWWVLSCSQYRWETVTCWDPLNCCVPTGPTLQQTSQGSLSPNRLLCLIKNVHPRAVPSKVNSLDLWTSPCSSARPFIRLSTLMRKSFIFVCN